MGTGKQIFNIKRYLKSLESMTKDCDELVGYEPPASTNVKQQYIDEAKRVLQHTHHSIYKLEPCHENKKPLCRVRGKGVTKDLTHFYVLQDFNLAERKTCQNAEWILKTGKHKQKLKTAKSRKEMIPVLAEYLERRKGLFTYFDWNKCQERNEEVRARWNMSDKCVYCQIPFSKKNRCALCSMEYDHIFPLSKGGYHTYTPRRKTSNHIVANLLPCCRRCNRNKADIAPEVFIKKIQILQHLDKHHPCYPKCLQEPASLDILDSQYSLRIK